MSQLNRLVLVLACIVCSSVEAATIRRVLGPGDSVPGVPGATFVGSFGDPSFDHLGDVRIKAIIEGPGVTWRNSSGFWIESDSHLKMVFRDDDALPGAVATNGSRVRTRTATPRIGLRLTLQAHSLIPETISADRNASGLARTVARTGQQAAWNAGSDDLPLRRLSDG